MADVVVVRGSPVRVSTLPGFALMIGVILVQTDPTTVRLRWRPVGGVETVLVYGVDAAVVKDAVGSYHADIVPTVPGPHVFRWEGTGAVVAAGEGTFSVWSYF